MVRKFNTKKRGRKANYSPADALLLKLHKVHKRSQSSWVACCPAHQDDSPSLSIRETADGTILLKCFAGCDFHAIVAAVGLEASNLFPKTYTDSYDYGLNKKVRAPAFPWADMIRSLHEDLLVIKLGVLSIVNRDPLTADDLSAMDKAASTISTLIEEACGATPCDHVHRKIIEAIRMEEACHG